MYVVHMLVIITEKKYGVKEMDWKAYHRLDVIHNFIDGLEANYPSLCTAGVIGSSLEGRDLKVNYPLCKKAGFILFL